MPHFQMATQKRWFKYWGIAGLFAGLMLLAYFFGPDSKLTLIARLHYNTLFILTPCVGSVETYSDEAISFNYTVPPVALNRTASAFINPFSSRRGPESDISGYIDMNIPLKPSHKYKAQAAKEAGTVNSGAARLEELLGRSGPAPVKAGLKKGTGFIRKEGIFGGPGNFEFLYVLGKNDYVYRIVMPFYPYRHNDDFLWLELALYNANLLSRDHYTNLPQPRGFWNWFLTPSADKQAYCCGNTIRKTFEIKD